MTKAIRIENADMSDHKVRVRVEVWRSGPENDGAGSWVDSGEAVELSNPTAMLTTTIWLTRRLVIEEIG